MDAEVPLEGEASKLSAVIVTLNTDAATDPDPIGFTVISPEVGSITNGVTSEIVVVVVIIRRNVVFLL